MQKFQNHRSFQSHSFSIVLSVFLLVLSICLLSGSVAFAAQDVVFDECHAQTAGNADWTITGGFSDFADTFKEMGFNVVAAKKQITADILKNAAILVLPEPNSVYSSAEKAAISDFVKRGGGLFAIADHKGADRNNDGIDAIGVLNQVIPEFGLTFEINSISEFPIPINDSDDPILSGAKTMGTWAGTTVVAKVPEAVTLIKSRKQAGRFLMGYSAPKNAKGRVVAFGDSSSFDDGTGAPGNKLYDGYNRGDCSHIILAKNAINYLTKKTNSIARSDVAKNMTAGVSKHYDPAHIGHSHQSPDGTMYHQTGDFYPGSPASYPNGYPSNPVPQPQPPSYPNTPSYPSQPTYPSQPSYPQQPPPPSYPSYPAPGYNEDSALYQQGFKYFTENNFFMAIDSFKRLTKKYKSSQYYEGGMFYLALSYKSTYNYSEAIKTLKTMINELRYSPNRPLWFFTAGEVCETGYQFSNAAKWYESFLNEHSAHQRAAEALYKAGQAYEKGYIYKDAVRVYRRLTASYPYSPFAQMSYERLAALRAYGY